MPQRGINAGTPVRYTVDGVEVNTIWQEVITGLEVLNDDRDSLASLFTFTHTDSAHPVLQSWDGGEFEDASEFGVPTSSRLSMQVVMVAYNYRWRDYATRSTWQYLADAPADEVRAQISAAYEADNRQCFQAILTSIFDPTQRVNENGVPIYGLFNGDGFIPPTFRGTSFNGSHNHYMTTGSVVLDSGDIDAAVETVVEHGYGGDGGKVLIFVNPRERKVISKFRVDSAASFDFIPSVSAPAYLTSKQVIGSAAPANYGRVPIVGSYGDALVSESTLIPQGYVLVVATDGPNSRRNVVGLREHPTPSNRGLIAVPGPVPGYPLQESFFVRGFGTGVRHRGAAAVMQITTGSYTAPAQYRRAA